MDGAPVFDAKITVKLLKEKGTRIAREVSSTLDLTSESVAVTGSPIQMYSANAAVGVRSLPCTPHYNSSSPIVGGFSGWNGIHCPSVNPHSGGMVPAPVYLNRSYANNSDTMYNRPFTEPPRGHSPVVWPVVGPQYGRSWEDPYRMNSQKSFNKRSQLGTAREPNQPTLSNTPEGMRCIRGAHSGLNHTQAEWSMLRPSYCPLPPSNAFNGSNFCQNSYKRGSSSPLFMNQGRDHCNGQWNGQGQHIQPMRNTKTPSPYGNGGMLPMSQQSSRTSPYQHSESEEEVERFFNPINSRNSCPVANSTYTPIELQVTNLDQSLEPKEMKRILSCIFMKHIHVIHVSVFMQSDGNFAASVKVPSLQDAQYAISQLHRCKVGYKRILISYAHAGGPNPQLVRSQIVMLLQEVPGHKLPLFKFREMYESRFMISISVSELYKMKDVCIVTEDPSGRMVSLNPDHRNTPSPCIGNITQDGPLELPFCTIHMQKSVSDKGWAEQEMASLPNVMIPLEFLATRVEQLLSSHNGSLPLPSLPTCYEGVFQEALNVDENGVPLEHLVSCVPSVELRQGIGSVKYLLWVGDKCPDDSHEEINKCVSPPLANQLALFSRELVDLLKTAAHCQLPFNRFIPAYHHHFGRQCRVADYGFTKLIDLLEALPHTVQVMGEGNKRVVTLSHRAQVRRFTSDLLRVLKAQVSKQIMLSEFPRVYARVIGKPWDIVDYGVCEIHDILHEVSENTVVVATCNESDKLISIPTREQTPEEIERTKQFAVEVVELLRHAPQCSMQFNKFVPSYHHHFGHQCRVSDYGFTKLIELFEAIPHVVNIEDAVNGERRISLTEKEGLRVLGEQISKLVLKTRGGLAVSSIAQVFLHQFGYMLRPEFFGCSSMLQLMGKLDDTVKIIQGSNSPLVVLVDKSHAQLVGLQCRRILMDQSHHKMTLKDFKLLYSEVYSTPCNINEFKHDLSEIVKFSGEGDKESLQLTPLQCLACNIYKILMSHGGKLSLQKLENTYLNTFGKGLNPAQYGFPTLSALLQALPCTVTIKETRTKKKNIFLSKKLATVGIPLPSNFLSPHRGNNSSNESLESDQRIDINETAIPDKWMGKNAAVWNDRRNITSWKKDHQWGLSTSDKSLKWPILESSGESFFKSLINTPTLIKDLPKPPKPDTPPNGNVDGESTWKSSVWSTPPHFNRDIHGRSIEIPPITLPTWNNTDVEDSVLNLLSPAKYLLPATANPLNPKTPPYYSTKHLVIAPHPSELPLPSLTLAPRRSLHSNNDTLESRLLGNSLEVHSPTNSENYSVSESESSDALNTTPSKKMFAGKRRLAAQFNQPMD
ncbi:meiosis arrest female protein 1 isoform X2 [Fopius arisanus]|nr:PREDICTED: meiosis arrest female protein 1 isoform X2 [Fopius arisanus]XP_011307136.1 PREDICTED: meiosis arrest female protein 1 isoform X2 [Fopius arisanus]